MSWSWSLPQSTRYVMLFSERVERVDSGLAVVVLPWSLPQSTRYVMLFSERVERVDSGLAVVVLS